MDFTYESYSKLIKLLQDNGYEIRNYQNHIESKKCAILRHDVDFDLYKAATFSKYEKELGVKSVYFVLVSSNFYNVHSSCNTRNLYDILDSGHEVGLHFDEVKYAEGNIEKLEEAIYKEAEILGNIIGKKINAVSMHRPSQKMLSSNLKLDGMVNTYGTLFFQKFQYLSDSRMNWRIDPEPIIRSGNYNKIQLLTHPFWYTEQDEMMTEKLKAFVLRASKERYIELSSNIKDIESALPQDEL